jgi:hypothetical protein
MAIKPQTARKFDKSSPVARYWLARCEGFRVEGPLRGTVEKVVGSGDLQDAEALVVRTAWRRRSIPVADVGAVVPAARLIVVDDPQTELAPARAQQRARALSDASSAAVALGRVARAGALLVAVGVVAVAHVAFVLAINGARFVRALVAQLRSDIHVAAERRRRVAAVRASRPRPR